MKLFYADHFVLPLPEGHRFPMEKYSRLRQRLRNDGEFDECDFRVPRAVDDATLGLAHCPDYVARVSRGALTRQEIRRIGFPWSPEMVERSRRSAGATLEACRAALIDGVAANLAGGTHHAFRDRGEGFCVFNDAAVAARALRAEGRVQRIAIVDCDVHQGNGTASILANDDAVFTFSIHGAKNFPFHKETSDLDIELPDDTGDDTYLAALDDGLVQVFSRIDAQLVIYLAGADPFEDDRLGRLRLTKAGLARRDAQVLNACKARGIPLAVAMAGGYARNIDDTVDIHAATILTAQRLFA
ncbi:MAG TPA: histone deacetylase [Rhodocyclaceae bacterium]|nr:histone deacetylase [Rhodocyclaceae bacterium]HMZ83420.1 histone deacetylase [Rhodocyclaceae bacterium]HNA02552.1 histone deacetylase [Rhodocyclaceae bacterium]HNB77229.1 histone deacetylase [Rhodocyclaceae bacterium]HNC61039.1 histone deacetylase [Rhodocyclaceae bacterium]